MNALVHERGSRRITNVIKHMEFETKSLQK